MAKMTSYGDPAGCIYNGEHQKNYYKGWYYLGQINGMDGYVKDGDRFGILLSLVYGYKPWEYGSPCFASMSDPRRLPWFKENSKDNYELYMRAANVLHWGGA